MQRVRRGPIRILGCSIVAVLGLTAWRLWPIWQANSMREAVLHGKAPDWWPSRWRKEFASRYELAELVPTTNRNFKNESELASLAKEIGVAIAWDPLARQAVTSELDQLPSFYGPVCVKTSLRDYCDQQPLGLLLHNGTITITTRSTAAQSRTRYNSLALSGCGIEMLKAADVRARREAAFALGEYLSSPQTDLPALIGALEDDDPDVRANVLYAVRRMGPDAANAIPAIERLLRQETEPYVYWRVVRTLGEMGPAALPGLIAGTQHSDVGIRRYAVQRLEKLGEHAVQLTISQFVIDLKSDDIYASARAALGLRSLQRHGTFAAPIASHTEKNLQTETAPSSTSSAPHRASE
jgi:HEAT repeats